MESPRSQAICLWVTDEAHYDAVFDDPRTFRAHIDAAFERHPELFPPGFESGYTFHDVRTSKKLGVRVRRLRLRADGRVHLLRPCFLMPWCVGRVEDFDRALLLRLAPVSFDLLSECFGRPPKAYERAFVSLARRANLVAATCKAELPGHLLADEKHVTSSSPTEYLCVTVASGCILGANLAGEATTEAFTLGYAPFAREARAVDPGYRPLSVCLDGFRATRAAWRGLFPRVAVVLCFLHSVLGLRVVGPKKEPEHYSTLMAKAWEVFAAPSRAHFAQRLRRLDEWAQRTLGYGKLKERVGRMRQKSARYAVSYSCAGSARTSAGLDRLMSHQSHVLRAQRGFHGRREHADAMMRAHALVWNFHPYGQRLRREQHGRVSPFHDLNGFVYHDNWLSNLLLASSCGGLGSRNANHQIRRS